MEVSKELLNKSNYLKALSDILQEKLKAHQSGENICQIKLLEAKCKHADATEANFVLPKSLYTKAIESLVSAEASSEIQEMKLNLLLKDLKELTETWQVPLETVTIANRCASFVVNLPLLARCLVSNLIFLNVSSLKTHCQSNCSKTVVCCVPNDISSTRTFAILATIKNMQSQQGKNVSWNYLSKHSHNDIFKVLENMKVHFSFPSPSISEDGGHRVLTILKTHDLVSSDENTISFNSRITNICNSKYFALLQSQVGTSKLTLHPTVISFLHRFECSFNDDMSLDNILNQIKEKSFLFVACQSDSLYVKQLRLLMMTILHLKHCAQLKEHLSLHKACMLCDTMKTAFEDCEVYHGPVTVSTNGESFLKVEEIFEQYASTTKKSFQAKYGQNQSWLPLADTIASSVLKIDLLSISIPSPISLKPSSTSVSSTFVLYNYSRLATLLEKFAAGVNNGVYPPLPEITEVNFSLLKEPNERQLIDLLWKFNGVILDCLSANKIGSKQVKPHLLIAYLKTLCKSLSCYYSRHHILGNGMSHLFPTMFARLYLIKAVKNVMLNIFWLLDIKPVEQM